MALTPAELAALRQEYSRTALRRADLAPEPIAQFAKWFAEAHEAGVLEPNAMIVATVDATGQPWTRTVLLKICDERGFTFFTNYDGAKATQIAANPRVALTFLWTAIERQVNVTGRAEKTSREESAAYFASRPRASQLGAWSSRQSTVIADQAQLQRQYAEAEARFAGGDVPLPPNWGGYCVVPETVEFWQGSRSRLHDRLRYTREAGGDWFIERLSP
jgi:pyridoxamine 5'-phosphate oxidase